MKINIKFCQRGTLGMPPIKESLRWEFKVGQLIPYMEISTSPPTHITPGACTTMLAVKFLLPAMISSGIMEHTTLQHEQQ
jgi:hypothetical protein